MQNSWVNPSKKLTIPRISRYGNEFHSRYQLFRNNKLCDDVIKKQSSGSGASVVKGRNCIKPLGEVINGNEKYMYCHWYM